MAKIRYKDGSPQLVHDPLWWHEHPAWMGARNPTGYGNKITTPYKVQHLGRLYRVYAICHSNVASYYILPRGEKLYLRDWTLPENQ